MSKNFNGYCHYIQKKKQETLIYYMNMTGHKSYSIHDDAIINNNNFTLMEMIYR